MEVPFCTNDDDHSFYDVVTSSRYDLNDSEILPVPPMPAPENVDEIEENILEEGEAWGSQPAERNLLKEKLSELHCIFVSNGVTLRGAGGYSHIFQKSSVRNFCKIAARRKNIAPPAIAYSCRIVSPGAMIYFGIERMLNWTPSVLSDEKCNEILLSANMDGVPLTHSAHGKSFWPILCSIGDYPTFPIGSYEGVKKPA